MYACAYVLINVPSQAGDVGDTVEGEQRVNSDADNEIENEADDENRCTGCVHKSD